MRTFIFFVTLATVTACTWIQVIETYTAEEQLWQQENACIAELVAQGIERRDIKRDNGGCYVAE